MDTIITGLDNQPVKVTVLTFPGGPGAPGVPEARTNITYREFILLDALGLIVRDTAPIVPHTHKGEVIVQ